LLLHETHYAFGGNDVHILGESVICASSTLFYDLVRVGTEKSREDAQMQIQILSLRSTPNSLLLHETHYAFGGNDVHILGESVICASSTLFYDLVRVGTEKSREDAQTFFHISVHSPVKRFNILQDGVKMESVLPAEEHKLSSQSLQRQHQSSGPFPERDTETK
ncbi:uncharacterized, partial [Tachysurus ichikawai]